MDINIIKLFAVALVAALSLYFIGKFRILLLYKIYASSIVVGIVIFNGIGAAYQSVPIYYLVLFILFLGVFIFSFRLFLMQFGAIERSTYRVQRFSDSVDSSRIWSAVVFIYLLLVFFPLLYPEFRVFEIFNPPSPDLAALFGLRFEAKEVDYLNKIVFYLKTLITPFVLISIFKYRKNFLFVIAIITLPLYIRYIEQAYISRGEIFSALGVLVIGLWFARPDLKGKIRISTLLIIPIFVIFSAFWQIIRLGDDGSSFSLREALETAIETQTNFPEVSGVPLIESGKNVDFSGYIKWLVTMPIPKVLIGDVEGARIGYEVSEIVLNKYRGEPGYYILLPGLIAESVYIYGLNLFWIHAIFLACVCAFVASVTAPIKSGVFLNGYILAQFSYTMTRGGVGAILPELINGFLLYYIMYFYMITKFKPKKS